MWNTRLKELLQRFLQSKDSQEIEDYFVEQTQSFHVLPMDPDATTALSENERYNTDSDLSLGELKSMHFDLPHQETELQQFSGERYRKQYKLGQGGMAIVWQMEDRQLLRSVALKELLQEKSKSTYEKESFIVEAQITSQLQHPGIVPIYDLQIDDTGNVYFTMQEIQGQTLEAIISTVHRISDTRWNTSHTGWNLRRLIDAIQQICQTLAYAHSRGVIHQDIKPANIMVGDYGEILVVDWGVARVQSLFHPKPHWVRINASPAFIAHKRTAVSGTPRYMAPEQIHGDPSILDERIDVYAVGIILYYILSKDKPFVGNMEEILRAKKSEQLSLRKWVQANPSALNIPAELIDICDRAIATNPMDRFKDAREMQQAIQAWLDGARQEEEARTILREMDAEKFQIHQLEENSRELFATLNQPSIDATHLSEAWWNTWQTLLDYRHKTDAFRDSIYQKAQGAILYAPHLPEIYHRLIELEYEDYLEALSEGKHKSIAKTERRLNAYLQYLPQIEQDRWNNIRTVDLASLQSQKSQGVNIDRYSEKSSILKSLEKHAWTSIVGFAGVGKTHLAWQAATQWCKEKGWEIVFCDATDCETPAVLLQRLTQALQVSNTGSDPFDLVISLLNRSHPSTASASEQCLLIIDNTEYLNQQAGDILWTLLTRCPNVRLITTTRTLFNHPEEHSYTLHPMSFLNSVELFAQHCKQKLPNWSLTPNNRDLVLNIVNTLDRIPLAIELAGARIAEFSLTEIVDRLGQRFGLLRSKDSEQPTLQMALEWSCASLSDIEKHVLSQLSVFPKAFSLPIAEAIVELPNSQTLSDILDVLTQHSLITREYHSGSAQYTMLKSIRDYAAQQLSEVVLTETYHSFTKHFATEIKTLPHKTQDLEYLRVASIHGHPEDSAVCCAHLLKHIKQYGPMITGLEIAQLFLNRADITAKHSREVDVLYVDFLLETSDTNEALQYLMKLSARRPQIQLTTDIPIVASRPSPFLLSQARRDSTQFDDRQRQLLWTQYTQLCTAHQWEQATEIAQLLFALRDEQKQMELLQYHMNELRNAGHLKQALGIGEHLEQLHRQILPVQKHEQLKTLIDIAVLHTRLGNREQAIERYHLALSLAEEQHDQDSQARIIGNLGLLYQADGNLDLAIRQYKRALDIFQSLGQVDKESALQGNLGTIYQERDEVKEAINHFDIAIQKAEESDNAINKGVFLGNRAMCLIELNKHEAALKDFEEAIAICDRHIEFAAGAFRGELSKLMIQLGRPNDALSLLKKGEEQVKEHKEQYGKFLCRKAEVFYALHDWEMTKSAIRTAEDLCTQLQLRPTSSLKKMLNDVQTNIPAEVWLHPDEFQERRFIAEIAMRWAKYELMSTRYPQTMHHLHQALPLFTMLGHEGSALHVRYQMAVVLSHTGEIKEAIAMGKAIRQQHQLRGEMAEYGTVSNFLGGCYRRIGDVANALAHHEESLQILESLNHIHLTSALEKAGLCCRIMADYEKSLAYMTRALQMAITNNLRTGTLYCNVGLCHNVMGEEDKALHFYQLGIQELKRVGDRNRSALYLGNVANIYARRKNYTEAESLYKEVIEIAVQTGVKSNECITRGNYGDLLVKMKHFEDAEHQLEKAIALGVEIYPVASNVFTGVLAELHSQQGRHQKAIELLKSIDWELMHSDVEEYTKLCCVSSEIYLAYNQIEEAQRYFSEATALLKEQEFAESTDVYQKWLHAKERLEATVRS